MLTPATTPDDGVTGIHSLDTVCGFHWHVFSSRIDLGLSEEKKMKKLLVCTGISAVFLSGCSAIDHNKNSTAAVNGLQLDNSGHYQYVKNTPASGQMIPDALKVQGCSHTAVSGAETRACVRMTGCLYTIRGKTSYSITSLCSTVTFVVGSSVGLGRTSSGLR